MMLFNFLKQQQRMIKISSAKGTCGTIVCNLLMELKIPFIVNYVELNSEHDDKYSLFGKVPVLIRGDFSITQTTAICLYICENFDLHGKMLSLNKHQRFKQIESMMALATDIQPMIRMLFKSHIDKNLVYESLITEAVDHLYNMQQASGSSWLFGDSHSLNDLYAFELMRWVSNTKFSSSLTPITPWMSKCMTIDSVKESIKKENLKVWGCEVC